MLEFSDAKQKAVEMGYLVVSLVMTAIPLMIRRMGKKGEDGG